MNNFSLTRQDTSVMKGIAICAMLCHHLYTCPEYIGCGIVPYHGILAWVGVLGKVCVALFLFCSGYGLSVNYSPISIKEDAKFIVRRLIKFYANYWVIFAIFVPISIFVFHRSLIIPYGEDACIPLSFFIDVLGMQGDKSYNITWGFNQLIIVLYLLFPILYHLVYKIPWITIVILMTFIHFENSFLSPIAEFITWKFPFALAFIIGIIWHKYENYIPKVCNWAETHKIVFALLAIMGVCMVTLLRMYPIIPHWTSINLDAMLSCSIALLVLGVIRYMPHVTSLFAYLGRHSMNIYMTHTFINAYWYPEWLHTSEWLRGGGNFVVLMTICLVISIGIEFFKEKIRLYELVNNITKRI